MGRHSEKIENRGLVTMNEKRIDIAHSVQDIMGGFFKKVS